MSARINSRSPCRRPRPPDRLGIFFEREKSRGLGQGFVLAPQLSVELADTPLLLGLLALTRVALQARQSLLAPTLQVTAKTLPAQ